MSIDFGGNTSEIDGMCSLVNCLSRQKGLSRLWIKRYILQALPQQRLCLR